MNKKLLIFIFLGIFLFSLVSVQAIDTTNLVSYYKLDENSANTNVADAHGSNTGTASTNTANLYTASGKINSAFDFDGSTEYVDTGFAPSYQSMSVSLWYKGNLAVGGNLFSSVGNTLQNGQVQIYNSAGNLRFGMIISGAGVGVETTDTVFDSNWHHLVLTYSSGGYLKGYLDGNLTASLSIASFTAGNTQDLWIMRNPRGGGGYGIGLIDEFAIFDTELTSTEVSDLYNSGSGLAYPFTTASPTITLNSPVDTYNSSSQTINFNITATDDKKIENVSLYIDGVLNETNSSNVNGTYIFTKTLSDGNYNWSILAYDNDSQSTQSNTRTFTISKVVENSQTYTTPVLTGSDSTFYANITLRDSISLDYVSIVYGGTTYLGSYVDYGDYILIEKELTIPVVSTSTTKQFNWVLNLNDSTTYNLTTKNQTISTIGVDNCLSYTNTLYNFTIVDELTQSELDASTDSTNSELSLTIKSSSGTEIVSYSKEYDQINPFQVCISSNLSNSEEYKIDVEVKYSASGYETENFNIQYDSLNYTDLNTNITLYDLDNSTSTLFKITYKDQSYLPVKDALISIQRKYLSEGVFKTIEAPITDSNGELLAHLEVDNAIYKFVISKAGNVLATFESAGVKCANALTGDCTLSFNDLSSSISSEDYTDQGDFDFTISYDEDTRIVTAIFSSTGVVTARLNVSNTDGSGSSVCSNIVSSNSGTLTCTIPLTTENTTLSVRIYMNDEFQGQGFIKIGNKSSDLFGLSQVFLTMFLYFTLIGIGITDNPLIEGLFMIIGGILAVGMNVVEGGGGFIGASATILWLIVAIVIVLTKGSRRG